MEQIVRIRRLIDDKTAEVIRIRESACSGECHKCSGCGAAQETLVFEAENPIGAKAGELVTISSASGPVIKAAAMLYVVPLALFFAGYWVGAAAWNHGALIACIAFSLGIALAILYDRKVLRHQKTVYTITGYPTASMWESHTKGDNNLD